MRQKPNLTDHAIIACVRERYGLAVTELAFLPIGNDSSAGVYRVEADDGKEYFLKVRIGHIDEIGLTVPRALAEAGVTQVVAPIPPGTGEKPWATVGDYAVILYPFLRARSAMEAGLSDAQWIAYGALLGAVHGVTLPDAVRRQVPRETFVSTWAEGVRRLQGAIERGNHADPYARELAAIWHERRDEIRHVVERVDGLGWRLRDRHGAFVLCHTDPHTNNVLVDADGRLFLIDWDAPLLAPKERDLHFVVGSAIGRVVIGPREEGLIFQGYGQTTLDWLALTYYRHEWVCGDLFEYGKCVLTREDTDELTKQEAIRVTRQMFEPGRSVASAYELERRWPRPV